MEPITGESTFLRAVRRVALVVATISLADGAAVDASKRWRRPVSDWKNALNQFAMQYDSELELRL